MTQPPLQYATSRDLINEPRNTIGLVGFILVMVGLVGLCFAPALLIGFGGLVCCIIGVFRRPRGLALAGLIVGLLEVLAVIAIAVVAGAFIFVGAKRDAENAKMAVSSESARVTGNLIYRYNHEHDKLPTSLADLTEATSDTLDGYGRPIRYLPNVATGEYKLLSDGPDGVPNTPDDITLADTSKKPYSNIVIPTMPPARAPATVPAMPTFDDPK